MKIWIFQRCSLLVPAVPESGLLTSVWLSFENVSNIRPTFSWGVLWTSVFTSLGVSILLTCSEMISVVREEGLGIFSKTKHQTFKRHLWTHARNARYTCLNLHVHYRHRNCAHLQVGLMINVLEKESCLELLLLIIRQISWTTSCLVENISDRSRVVSALPALLSAHKNRWVDTIQSSTRFVIHSDFTSLQESILSSCHFLQTVK